MEDVREFLCCKCGKIPEILNVHTDNSRIEFNCKKCGTYEILVDEYYDKLYVNNYFKKCRKCKNKGIYNNKFYYCSTCKDYFCELCKANHNDHKYTEEKKKDHYFFNKCCNCENNNINKNKYFYCFICMNDICQDCKDKENCINKGKHQYIDEKEKKITCLEHKKQFKFYCHDCIENFCEECEKIKHEGHKKENLDKLSGSLADNRTEIMKINEELNNLVELNEIILQYNDFFENNPDYLKSIINIGKSLKEGNERKSKDIKCLLKSLGQDIKISEDAIDDLITHRKIQLSRNERYINLNKRKLDDQDFKYISQIRFNQLKEIDISENEITNVEPLKKMRLPFLEFLNLSHNKIKLIEPLSKLKSEKLEYIFLQNNKIEDIESLLKSDFPYLKLLRVEDYNCDLKNKDEPTRKKEEDKLLEFKKALGDKFIYKSIEQQIKEFEHEYELDISCESDTIDLSDVKGGSKMLKKLFLIITYMPKNKIQKLSLRNNNIKDPSILNRINFDNLDTLDLAVNYIEDLNFLLDIKAKNLKYLYLDNNNFKQIYQILKAKLPKLEVLSLNENKFDSNEMEESPIYEKLDEKKIEGREETIKIQLKREDSDLHKKTKKKKNANQNQQPNNQNPQENNGNEEQNEEGQNVNHPEEANSNS